MTENRLIKVFSPRHIVFEKPNVWIPHDEHPSRKIKVCMPVLPAVEEPVEFHICL
jgi:hypothetical protein